MYARACAPRVCHTVSAPLRSHVTTPRALTTTLQVTTITHTPQTVRDITLTRLFQTVLKVHRLWSEMCVAIGLRPRTRMHYVWRDESIVFTRMLNGTVAATHTHTRKRVCLFVIVDGSVTYSNYCPLQFTVEVCLECDLVMILKCHWNKCTIKEKEAFFTISPLITL